MKNKRVLKIVVIIASILIIAAVTIVIVKSMQETEIPGPIDDNPIEETTDLASKVIVESSTTQVSSDKKNIKTSIPVIKSLKAYSFQAAVNKEIAECINPYKREIDIVLDEETPDTTRYEYLVEYERYNNGNYLSLVINQNYQTGGIRSNIWKDIFNIDVYNNKRIYLVDLFDANIDYEKAIIAEITKQAKEKNYELVGGNGISELVEGQKFYIEEKQLVIYFDPAEVAPNAYGELTFIMPFVLNDDGHFSI